MFRDLDVATKACSSSGHVAFADAQASDTKHSGHPSPSAFSKTRTQGPVPPLHIARRGGPPAIRSSVRIPSRSTSRATSPASARHRTLTAEILRSTVIPGGNTTGRRGRRRQVVAPRLAISPPGDRRGRPPPRAARRTAAAIAPCTTAGTHGDPRQAGRPPRRDRPGASNDGDERRDVAGVQPTSFLWSMPIASAMRPAPLARIRPSG
jgi:hypothetical protein